jgi:hypothetical protein
MKDYEPMPLSQYIREEEARARQEQVDWAVNWGAVKGKTDQEIGAMLEEAYSHFACNDPLLPLLCEAAERLSRREP